MRYSCTISLSPSGVPPPRRTRCLLDYHHLDCCKCLIPEAPPCRCPPRSHLTSACTISPVDLGTLASVVAVLLLTPPVVPLSLPPRSPLFVALSLDSMHCMLCCARSCSDPPCCYSSPRCHRLAPRRTLRLVMCICTPPFVLVVETHVCCVRYLDENAMCNVLYVVPTLLPRESSYRCSTSVRKAWRRVIVVLTTVSGFWTQ